MTDLKPFFTYFGGKYRAAPLYPPPKFVKIVEPFAGSAGYSLRYAQYNVTLNDANPVIAELWRYLIRVSPSEILRIPLNVDHISNLKVCQEAKWLVGFWLNKGMTSPCNIPSKWMRDYSQSTTSCQYWGQSVRLRIARQLGAIRHWKVYCGNYRELPDVKGTWFIDPPYSKSPKVYGYWVDYPSLSKWCQSRLGQVIVCEQQGASWMPFKSFHTIRGLSGAHGCKTSNEVIWTNQ